jgi:hypothetical protein
MIHDKKDFLYVTNVCYSLGTFYLVYRIERDEANEKCWFVASCSTTILVC